MRRDSKLVRGPDNVRGHPPPLSRSEKFARTKLSGAKENKKRCPPIGSSGSTALIVWIFCGKEANDDNHIFTKMHRTRNYKCMAFGSFLIMSPS